jgi:hypothetical protein
LEKLPKMEERREERIVGRLEGMVGGAMVTAPAEGLRRKWCTGATQDAFDDRRRAAGKK